MREHYNDIVPIEYEDDDDVPLVDLIATRIHVHAELLDDTTTRRADDPKWDRVAYARWLALNDAQRILDLIVRRGGDIPSKVFTRAAHAAVKEYGESVTIIAAAERIAQGVIDQLNARDRPVS